MAYPRLRIYLFQVLVEQIISGLVIASSLHTPTHLVVFSFQIEISASYSLWFSKGIRADRES